MFYCFKVDTSFLKKPNNITPQYSYNIVGGGDNEQICYKTKDFCFDKIDAIKIIKLITNIENPIIVEVNSSYSEIFDGFNKIGFLEYKELCIYFKNVNITKLKNINNIKDFL